MEYKKVPQQINDIVGDNVKLLAQIFPSAVKDGQVDFEALREELGEFEEVGTEKYDFTWTGKQESKQLAQQDIFNRTLNYIPEDSKNGDTTENIYIEGDNLEVLKLLRQNYYNSIKMIYIDPPYNKDKDFIYNDRFKMDAIESDIAEGIRDKEGNPLQKNSKSSNRYHAKWLNMIYPRLRIAKDLLADNGVIFISIDDNEVHNLRKICDEIFGQQNFLGKIIRKTKTMTGDEGNGLNIQNDYLLLYCKNVNEIFLIGNEKDFKGYKNPDNDINGEWCSGDPSAKSGGNGTNFPIINPYTNKVDYPPKGRYWAFSKSTLEEYIKKCKIIFKKQYKENERGFIFKRYKNELKSKNNPLNTLFIDNKFMNEYGNNEFKILFENTYFDYVKPLQFIKELIKSCINDNDIILDFFSGSATTAHAVMQLNAEDGSNLKFIMVQYPELIDEDTEAYKAGYKNICEIGKERIRRAGEKIKQDIEESNKQIQIGEEPKKVPDIGFKVFRTSDTNIKWNYQQYEEIKSFSENYASLDIIDFTPDFKDIDIVYEIMLRQKNVPLSSTVETLTDIGERTYLYASSYLICLETEITENLIDKLAMLDPLPIKFVFRDSAFKDDIDLKDLTFRRLKSMIERNLGVTKHTYNVEFI